MKRLYTLLFIILITQPAFSQGKWDKAAITKLEDECIAYLAKTYKNLDENQRETIAICFSKEIRAKYTSKEEFDNISDRELTRVKSTYISQCAKTSLSIELRIPEQKVEEQPTKENLIGHWQDEESEFYLNPDNSVKIFFNDKSEEKGDWTVNGNLLTITVNRKLLGKKVKEFKIFSFTKDQFLYQSQKSMENQIVKRLN